MRAPESKIPGHSGFLFDDLDPDSAWIREEASVRLPPMQGPLDLVIRGRFLDSIKDQPLEGGHPSLILGAEGARPCEIKGSHNEKTWEAKLSISAKDAVEGACIRFILGGVGLTNALAWLGRKTGMPALQRFRKQSLNRRLRVLTIEDTKGSRICDFSQRGDSLCPEFMHSLSRPGINVVGWIDAELGLGESARCMLRAAKAAGLPAVPVQLKITCKSAKGNTEFTPAPEQSALEGTNVFHIDPPASLEIDRRHGPKLRQGRWNVGYWAWEIEEFPDAWVKTFGVFDEIWCPSNFVRDAIAMKSPVPVVTMPHAISVAAPEGDGRARFGLPRDEFLFTFAYDLHSYSARKNPQAALTAYKQAGFGPGEAGIVIKVHGTEGNEAALGRLKEEVDSTPGAILICETLSRADLNLLLSACDCFVSLHRAEGFGLAVAEAMALGKPVIATDWSATTEFLNERNGCPVRYEIRQIGKNEGPYPKNGYWAEPDTTHAAERMRQLTGDRVKARLIGEAAQRTINEQFSPASVGARYRRRLQAIALFNHTSSSTVPHDARPCT